MLTALQGHSGPFPNMNKWPLFAVYGFCDHYLFQLHPALIAVSILGQGQTPAFAATHGNAIAKLCKDDVFQIAPVTHGTPRLHMEVQISSVTIGQQLTPQWQQRALSRNPIQGQLDIPVTTSNIYQHLKMLLDDHG